ncbi:D-aspartate oxidase [Bactrocera neohumeralis]|uniref:D-aspartate oxidase n=1 Tax=Bactrocera neohumeralis TaxID=98809 RepID=UPI0021660C7F|nr:D-aspartate oxidase [Bactrocera neohumeralis]XP_050326370.1 D-aspartate oxidase [Bactrocera neohumeralis]XP_050326371.1 D-aspartate oxidase [Bactrocera neohumeralis]
MHFGILGSGVVGLTTALELQQNYPNAQITILADRFNEETTSHVAAGIFRPGTSFAGPTREITQQWITDAFHYWDDIRRSKEAPLAGVCQLSGYIYSSTSPKIVRNPFIENLLPIYRQATEEELKLCQGAWKYGSFFTTCLTECGLFLPYATKKFIAAGGQVTRQHVSSFSDVSEQNFDVLFNCTGLGAKELCNDAQLVPMRGQVVKVRAPWVKLAFYGDYDTYILPGFEAVTLGGCRQYDSFNLNVCKYDSMAIKERCYGMLPSLKRAEVVREAVGLRPHRAVVRVESEILRLADGRTQKVVHNYGHGGYGVTTSPGTAKYAVKIARDLLAGNSKL